MCPGTRLLLSKVALAYLVISLHLWVMSKVSRLFSKIINDLLSSTRLRLELRCELP
jgi:hypothetical protein